LGGFFLIIWFNYPARESPLHPNPYQLVILWQFFGKAFNSTIQKTGKNPNSHPSKNSLNSLPLEGEEILVFAEAHYLATTEQKLKDEGGV